MKMLSKKISLMLIACAFCLYSGNVLGFQGCTDCVVELLDCESTPCTDDPSYGGSYYVIGRGQTETYHLQSVPVGFRVVGTCCDVDCYVTYSFASPGCKNFIGKSHSSVNHACYGYGICPDNG